MNDFQEYSSDLSLPHLGSGFTDIVAFVFDSPREYNINADYNDINNQNILEVKSFSFNFAQKSWNQTRYLGEGADSSVLSIGQVTIGGSLKTLLFQNEMGWVLPVFANIWHKAANSWWGTGLSAAGNLLQNISIGTTIIQTNNVSDFTNITTPFSLSLITDTETPENVTVSSVNKSTRTFNLSTGVINAHTASETTLVNFQNNNSFKPVTEPAFSLLSLREGLLAPCLINKIVIDANVGQDVEIDVEFKALGIYRDKQIDLNQNRQTIIENFSEYNTILRAVSGTNVKLQIASANTGTFGLPTALGDNLFSGYQGLDIPEFTITGVTLTIDNQLKEVYSSHSLKSDVQSRRRENIYPYALHSEGRTITGKIKYRSPINFFSNLERLAGPSSINGGGLTIDYGNFKITMSEIAWETSTSDGNMETQTREISFTMISETRNSMPSLEFSESEN